MLGKTIKKCSERWKRLLPPIRNCKICFKEIKNNDPGHLFNKDICVCRDCQIAMEPKFIKFKVDNYDALAIYDYNPFIRKLVYQFKGCYDYELNEVFLNCFYREIKLRYFDYLLIPIPSFKKDDEERGFNHVVETFKKLGLKTLDILEKTEKHKQATSNVKERREVYKSLALKSEQSLKNKKVLLVDDIYTTGATIRGAINLIEKLAPKQIKVLVIAKTKPKD